MNFIKNLFIKKINTDIKTLEINEVNWRYDKYWVKFPYIWFDKEIILDKIQIVNNIMNNKYNTEWINFHIDFSFEKWFGVSIKSLPNSIWASLRIKTDNNYDWKLNGVSKNKNYYSFIWYDIIHDKELEMLTECITEYIKL